MLTFEGLVMAERIKQDEKWGVNDHQPIEWLSILMEEVGELATAVIRYTLGTHKQREKELGEELIQCAAVCKAMWECGKRNKWIT